MRIYRISKKIEKRYIAVGLFFLMMAAAVLILRPVPYAKDGLNVVFYIFVVGLAGLHITRHRTFRMYISDSEIYCYNGLLNAKRIPLNIIEKIEYRPGVPIVVYTNIKNRTYKLLNVLTKEDWQDLFGYIQKKGSIQIVYLEQFIKKEQKEEVQEGE